MTSILDLPSLIGELPGPARERAERLFRVEVAEGTADPPPEMHAWLEQHFGSVEAVRRQAIVRVTNRWTLDGSLFSTLRGRRPIQGGSRGTHAEQVRETLGGPFCDPEAQTPAESWGRVHGRHAITGANAAKYDAHHGVMVFDEHDPLRFGPERVTEMLNLGREWAERERATDPAAVNYLLIWNCGQRAGGSVVHGHAQMLLGRGAHYPRVERLRRDALAYAAATGCPYLEDLVACHRDLGLLIGERPGTSILASLTPVKERELLVIGAPGTDEREPPFAEAVARTVVAFRDVLGVQAFNLALERPPIGDGPADGWEQIGPVVHLVDRGDPGSRASDIGAMELYAAAVVGADPFDIAERLRPALAQA